VFDIYSKLKKHEDENYYQYLWRVGGYVRDGEYSGWKEIVSFVNEALYGDDESQYRDESTYRKAVQYARNFYENGVFTSEQEYLKQMNLASQKIYKEKQKLSDERRSLNTSLRDQARREENTEYLESLIKNTGLVAFPRYDIPSVKSGKDLVVLLSDIHYGVDVENVFGTYNSEVCACRFGQLLSQINYIQSINNCEKVYILLLGDNISGNIHVTTRLENRENVIEQVQGVSELISKFIYDVSKMFSKTFVNSVPGNHSRIGLKDDVLRGERLDDLIPWYCKAKLSHISNIQFCEFNNYDDTIASVTIRGNKGLIVHGDFDDPTESGISKLTMMLGYVPEFIAFGHKHNNFYQDISNVQVIRGGSFMGTVDDYTISKRITGRPSQMCFTVTDNGIESLYPIIFK